MAAIRMVEPDRACNATPAVHPSMLGLNRKLWHRWLVDEPALARLPARCDSANAHAARHSDRGAAATPLGVHDLIHRRMAV